jgi:hypothetical protein
LEALGAALQQTQGNEAARTCRDEALTIFTELGNPQAEKVRVLIANILQTNAAGQDNTEAHRADEIEPQPPDKPDGAARGNT